MFFSRRKPGRSILVLDISSASVGGGMAYLPEGKPAVMCYTKRVDLKRASSDALTNAMLRALEEVGQGLLKEGAPALRQCSGSGRIDRIVVSIGSPWQESRVVTKPINKEKSFTYTKSLEKETLLAEEAPEGRIEQKEVLATFLNGYLVKAPYGREATRAELVVLSSTIEKRIIEAVEGLIKSHFHASDIIFTDFAAPCYGVLTTLYPHEHDFLVLRAAGEATEVASMKRGHLIDVGSLAHGANALTKSASAMDILERPADDTPAFVQGEPRARFETGVTTTKEDAWITSLAELLRTFAVRHALPRTVFLIAEDHARDHLKEALNSASLRSLWLSDEPISVIPIQPQHFTPYVKTQGLATGDVPLAVLALYACRTSRNS